MKPKDNHFSWNFRSFGNSKGVPLVWLHGFMGSGIDWLPFTKEYFSDYNNFMVDLPGHGESVISEPADFTDILKTLIHQLTDMGVDRFIPIGYSMGGRVALHIQQLLSHRIPALIGISTAPGLKTIEERKLRVGADSDLMDKMEQLGIASFLDMWYRLDLFRSICKNDQIISHLLTSRVLNSVDQLRTAISLMGNGALPSLWEAQANMDIPVLLISGELDSKYCQINNEMDQRLLHGKHIIVPGGDHAFHIEKPLETAQVIRQFLSEIF